jgi:hypothetical protein
VDPSYLLVPDGLKFRGQHTLFKSWEKALSPPALRLTFGRMLSVSLVLIGTIVVIVLIFTLLLFKALTLLTPVFYPAACISATNDVM